MSGFLGLGGPSAVGVLGTFFKAGSLVGLGKLTLQLGSVVFNETALEVPQEIGNLGGRQVIEEHDFPGGSRTQQTFGAFPDEIAWRGLFTGASAWTRALTLDQLRVAGQPVTLSYGPKSFSGRIVEFIIRPRHQWLIEYHIRFLPLFDAAQQQASGQSPETVIASQNGILTQALQNLPFTLPSSLVSAVTSFQSTVESVLQQADGIVTNIGLPALTTLGTAVSVVTAITGGLIATGSSQDAYMAGITANAATSIYTTAQSPNTTKTVLGVVNPNLPQIAAQYLGDATEWPTLAELNNISPAVPFPIGTFQLVIPA